MLRMILALLISFIAVLLAGPKVIDKLHRLKFGQPIYELMPEEHKKKQGTPTMGGVLIAGGTVLAALVCHPQLWYGANDFMLAGVLMGVLTMLIGFVDDYIKVVKKRSLGLTPWQKIVGQVVVAVAFSCYCYFHPMIGSSVIVPFVNAEWDLGAAYIPLMSIVIIFMVNSANLQDGLDGLLSSVTAIGSGAFSLVAVFMLPLAAISSSTMTGDNYYSAAILGMALTGATLGFLRFNHYPAKVFMGDSGSFFIGGTMVALAMLLRQPLLMLPICFTMICSSVSVIVQRAYFKATHGKRIIKMSPIHYHFQLSGYSETQVVSMYAVITAILSLIALLSVNVSSLL